MTTMATGPAEAEPPQRSRGGAVLIGALVVDSVGAGLFLPLSLVFFTELTDVPLALLGVLIGVANAITLPVPVWAGALADRLGALPLVAGSQLMQACGYFAYGRVDGPVGVLLSATLVAVGVRFFWSTLFTTIADHAEGSSSGLSKDAWYAWANTARAAGLGIGSLATGVAVADGRETVYRAVAHSAAVCFLAAAVAIVLCVRAPRARRGVPPAGALGYRTLLRDRPFLGLVGVNTVYAMTVMMLGLAMPTFVLEGLRGPAWLTPALLAGNTALMSVLAAPVVKRLAPFRRTRSIVLAAVLWTAWCLVLAVLVPGGADWVVPVLVGATLLFTLAEVVHAPVSTALAASTAPVRIRGRYLAVFQYSFTAAGIVAPVFFTSLFEVHRSAPWLVLAALNAASVAAVLALERRLPAAALRDDAPPAAG